MSKQFKINKRRHEFDEEQNVNLVKAVKIREQERSERQIERALRNKDYDALMREDNELAG